LLVLMAPRTTLLYELVCTVLFTVAITSCGAAPALLSPLFPSASPSSILFTLVFVLLTSSAFLFPGAFINPAATTIAFFGGQLEPARYLALVGLELVGTVAGFAAAGSLLAAASQTTPAPPVAHDGA
jgi:hypothetical protein